jgi:hypothetical protein
MSVVVDSEPVRRVVVARSVGRSVDARVFLDARCGG